MFDDVFNKENEFFSYRKYLNSIFDLPIAEISEKRRHGIFYFSKIQIEMIYFDYSNNEISFILEPLELMYTDLIRDKNYVLWQRKEKKSENKLEYKSALIDWILKRNIDHSSITDFGPFSFIIKEQSLFLPLEEAKIYIDIKKEDSKQDKKEIKEKMRYLKRAFKKISDDTKKSLLNKISRRFLKTQNQN